MTGNNPGSVGSENPHWKGGVHLRKDGYILIRRGVFRGKISGTKYTLLHRLIVEEKIGRQLLKSEVVHHKNGDKSDNRIENLEIITQAEHARLHTLERVRDKKGRML